jgi:benzil reductase ((S)-benzoin forming)
MKIAVVTGGSKGLGRTLCHDLIQHGYRVIEFSRSAPEAWSIAVDLSQTEDALEKISSALQELPTQGYEEILVINNAATLEPIGATSKKAPSTIVSNINTNFTSPVVALSRIIRHFQETPCRKVVATISSGAARKSYYGWSLYCATKAALESFFGALALEQQREAHPFIPIIIDPNVIDTEMQATIRRSSPADFPDVERFKRRKDEGLLAAPEVVATQVLSILARKDLEYGGRYEV